MGCKSIFECLTQTKPLTYLDKKHAYICFLFLVLFSLLAQAVRWALPSLQASGLQCASCGDSQESNYQNCKQQCLDLTDVQMGTLTGPAFTISMMIAAIPLGWLADFCPRVRLIWILSLAWSFGALAACISDGFWQMCICCILIGASIACVNPVAFSLLSDYFPPENRAFVISAFSAVIFIGYDAGLATGFIAQYLTWRWAFALLGFPGFFIFLPALLMREPLRGLSEQSNDDFAMPLTDDFEFDGEDDLMFDQDDEHSSPARSNFFSNFKQILTTKAFLAIWASATVRLLGGFALGGWLPTFFRRVFGLEPWEISLYLTIVLTIGGLAGSYLGGYLADVWSRKNKAGKVLLVLISTVLSIPFIVGMLFFPYFWVSLGCLLFASFFGEMWFGSSAAAVQDIVAPNLRATATSIYLLGIGIGGVAPVFVGWLDQIMKIPAPYGTTQEDAYDPSIPMLIVIGLCYFICALGYALTALILLKSSKSSIDDGFDREVTLRHTIPLEETSWNKGNIN